MNHKEQEDCIKEHISPVREALDTVQDTLHKHIEAQKTHEQKQSENMQTIIGKLDAVMPTVQEINDFRTFLRIGRRVGLGLVFVITVGGIISGGIFAIKQWMKN